jgi:hypothetical protein
MSVTKPSATRIMGKGLGVFASPDGLRWRELLDHPAITEGAFDSQNLAFYDPLRGALRGLSTASCATACATS